MNYGISVLFRAIPFVMALFCFGLGAFVFTATPGSGAITSGLVVLFLGVVCLSLFATAATIIRQLIGRFNGFDRVFYPLMGYLLAAVTIVAGALLPTVHPIYFVPGHIVIGLGLITGCVTTVATASSRFTLIPQNSAKSDYEPNSKGFAPAATTVFYLLPILFSAAGWTLTVVLLSHGERAECMVAGSVVGGISAICTSLIGLVVSIVRQESNHYNGRDRHTWYPLVLWLGSVVVLWGGADLWIFAHTPLRFLGWVLIGLGLICFSISSKVILLAKVWKGSYPMAKRIPLIPVLTALAALFISAFLYEWSVFDLYYFVPARVVAGFGAVCFTLFSIVSILESGTSKR